MAGRPHLTLTPRRDEQPDPDRHLTARFPGWSRNRIMRMVEEQQFPPPMNVEQTRDFLWSAAVIEQFELGQWRPFVPGLRVVEDGAA